MFSLDAEFADKPRRAVMSYTNSGYDSAANSLYNRIFKDAFAIAQIADLSPDGTIALARSMTDEVFEAIRQSQAKAQTHLDSRPEELAAP
jgi:hypothetical protein